MKKLLVCLLSVLMLTGCGTSQPQEKQEASSGEKEYNIGVVQFVKHPSLDDAYKGFEDELQKNNIKYHITYKDAQGEIPNAVSIAKKFQADKVDLIYAIATPAAQGAQTAVKDIPIVFSAVTDPNQAGLVGGKSTNIAGCSDACPTKLQLETLEKISGAKNIGIVYSTSEINSKIQVEEAKKAASELGLNIVDVGINNINDMPQAIDSMLGKSDAVYVITDNLVAKSLSTLTRKANVAKKPLLTAYIDSQAKDVLIANGFSYKEHGAQAADIAIDILKNGKKPSDIPVGKIEKTHNVVSKKVAEQLNMDMNNEVFKEAEIHE